MFKVEISWNFDIAAQKNIYPIFHETLSNGCGLGLT